MKIDFYMPTRIISGINCVKDNADCFRLGDSCIIVTGASSAIKCGALDDVIEVLCELGISYVVYDKCKPNPLLSDCFDGGQIAFESRAKFVIGIGGGSALDSAKAIAAYASNPAVAPMSLFETDRLAPSIPIIAIPTTGGTGSEVNPYSVITLDGMDCKKTFNSECSYPKFALLDPTYTYTLDYDNTISCMLDAFCHCIESFNSPKATFLSENAATFGAKKIWRELDKLEGSKDISEKTRERLLNASCAGGIAINATGTGFPHPMGYNLTFHCGVPHGRACACFIGKYIENCMKTDEGAARMTKFALRIGATPEEIALRIVRLAGVNVTLTEEEIDDFIEKIKQASNFANSHYVTSTEEAREIYRELFVK